MQGDISYTISDYEKAARMVDFSYKNTRKENQTALAEALMAAGGEDGLL